MDSLPGKMAVGATGGMGAAMFCHPFDVIRVMMQLQTERKTTLGTATDIYKEGGLRRGLYSGLSAAFLRQWTYGACRIGIYTFLLKRQGKDASFGHKLSFGIVSGGIGSFVGTPAELALVQMSADAKLPVAQRRGVGVHKVLRSVVEKDGFTGMWRGVGPTILRAMSLSSVTLAMTSELKERLPMVAPALSASPTGTMVVSTVIASFWATVASQPFDVVKSQMQNMKVGSDGVPPYSGSVDCAAKLFRQSPLTLMKGFTPAFVKLTPYTVLSLNIVELITKIITGEGAL